MYFLQLIHYRLYMLLRGVNQRFSLQKFIGQHWRKGAKIRDKKTSKDLRSCILVESRDKLNVIKHA